MHIDFAAALSARRRYFVMTQLVIPRPVAWVLSENESGTYNLACSWRIDNPALLVNDFIVLH